MIPPIFMPSWPWRKFRFWRAGAQCCQLAQVRSEPRNGISNPDAEDNGAIEVAQRGERKFSRPLLLRAHRGVTRRANCACSTSVG